MLSVCHSWDQGLSIERNEGQRTLVSELGGVAGCADDCEVRRREKGTSCSLGRHVFLIGVAFTSGEIEESGIGQIDGRSVGVVCT